MEIIADIYRIQHDLPFPGMPNTKLPAAFHCLSSADGLVLIDPFLLSDNEVQTLERLGTPVYVLITNQNHERSAQHYRKRYGAKLAAHRGLNGYFDFSIDIFFDDAELLPGGLTSIYMPGTFKGETIFWHSAQGGILIVGDAIMNMNLQDYGVAGLAMRSVGWPEGLGTMPRLLMQDEVLASESYRKLLMKNFSCILMTHGMPIRSDARGALLSQLNNYQSILPLPIRRGLSRFYKNAWQILNF